MPPNNFLPEAYLEKKRQRRANLFCLCLFVVVITGVVGAFFVTDRQWQQLEAQRDEVNTRYAQAAARLDQMQQLEAQREQLMHKAHVTSQLIEPMWRSVILAELVNQMPASVSLTELDLRSSTVEKPLPISALEDAKSKKQDAKNTAPRTRKVEVVELTLVGLAPTDVQVAKFMTDLSNCPLFVEMDLKYSQEATVEEQAVRRFRIDMRINPDVDRQQYEPTRVAREGLKTNPMDARVELVPINPPTSPASPASPVPATGPLGSVTGD